MPIKGRRPKPDGMRRNHHPPRVEWTEVPNVPYTGPAPELPPQPRGGDERPVPEPSRPLGKQGQALWSRAWKSASSAALDAEALLVVCEQTDERVALRLRVLRDKDWRSRSALRVLDQQVSAGLAALGLSTGRSVPAHWPAATRRWWRAVSRMPHCVCWAESDWTFALDTAVVAATFHAGDVRVAGEFRQRERIMGVTADSRRDLRIRYVEPDAEELESDASVTAMAAYRQMATDT
jgi:hypothetical protein